jgi:hypothetical protein
MHKYYQNKFKPRNSQKYKGDINGIWYRSSWECKFYTWLDTSSDVIEWSSEETVIKYLSPVDNKIHRYFPDAWAKIKTNNGIKEFIIEIKPFKQTIQPKTPKRKTKKYLNGVTTYLINDAKWKAAREYCLDAGMYFKIITEKELFNTK